MKFVAVLLLFGWQSLTLFGQAPQYHYRFDEGQRDGASFRPVVGDRPARVDGEIELVGEPLAPQAIVLDGKTRSITAHPDVTRLTFPAAALTLEARVMVLKTMEWGGLIGAIQDNGEDEHGFLLGFRQDRFCFAVATEGGGRLTYLSADTGFEVGRWYHVVGVYDGTTMSIFVDGQLHGTSAAQSGALRHAPRGRFEIGSYRDDNEFYRTEGLLHEVALYPVALTPEEVAARAAMPELPGPPAGRYGPFLEARSLFAELQSPVDGVSRDWRNDSSVVITWQGDDPDPQLFWGVSDATTEVPVTVDGRDRRAVIAEFRRDTEHRFRIVEGGLSSRPYLFDTTFDYRVSSPKDHPNPYDEPRAEEARRFAARVLDRAGVRRGYIFVLGAIDGSLAYHLAMASEAQVVVVERDRAVANTIRRTLAGTGLYGRRVSVHVADGDALPYGECLANVIVSERYFYDGKLPPFFARAGSLLTPEGGVFCAATLVPDPDWGFASWSLGVAGTREEFAEGFSQEFFFRRSALPGAGAWTHQYGDAANTACSDDDLVAGPLRVQWWGRPGPRPMPDRGNRNPAPLSAGGILYVQGYRTLFGLDAYNGTVLWCKQAPEVRRANVVRDCGNLAASKEHLYIATGPDLIEVHGRTGRIERRFTVPPRARAWGKTGTQRSWGFVGITEELIIGSTVSPESRYLGDEGEWYETDSAGDVGKVVGDTLFAIDRATGQPRWIYQGGLVANSTVSIAGNDVVFVDAPAETAAGTSLPARGRWQAMPTTTRLTTLDAATGDVQWQRPVDLQNAHFMAYLLAAGDQWITCTGSKDKVYELRSYSRKDGTPGWSFRDKDRKGHHGGHLQHPVVVGNELFVNRVAIELEGGSITRRGLLERRGCGTMAASNRAIAYRHHFHGVWDLEADTRQDLLGIRGGCWLGQIPAGGLLLAPETSAGCSCTHSLQISVAYRPASFSPPDPDAGSSSAEDR